MVWMSERRIKKKEKKKKENVLDSCLLLSSSTVVKITVSLPSHVQIFYNSHQNPSGIFGREERKECHMKLEKTPKSQQGEERTVL